MNKWWKDKKGVTVLEGVIALGLLAIVTAGSFGVLLSTSRQAAQPDMREEMALAIEKANDKLKAMLLFGNTELENVTTPYLPTVYQVGSSESYNLCPNEDNMEGLQVGTNHYISCLLPPICDPANSTFSYQVGTVSSTVQGSVEDAFNGSEGGAAPALYRIEYTISCNGYQL